jgi:hypothetical protein
MKKLSFVLLSIILILPLPAILNCSQKTPLTTKGNLKVLVLEGTPYERGLQHGTALKKEIHELVKLWKEDIQKTYQIEADVFIKNFLAATNFEKAIREWTPQLWDEVMGISKGSGIDLETFLFTFPGFIAANGINSFSVAVVVNAVQQLENSRDGLPVAFVIRGILQRKTYLLAQAHKEVKISMSKIGIICSNGNSRIKFSYTP